MEIFRHALAALVAFSQLLSWSTLFWLFIFALLAGGSALSLARLTFARNQIARAQFIAITAFRAKLGKIPSLVMSLRDHLYVPDEVFKVLIALYGDAVLREYDNPYSLLEAHYRIQHEIQFIMTVANKHHKVNLDGNFLYVRDFLIQYETQLRGALKQLAESTTLANRMYRWKNRFLLGLPFPPYTALPEVAV